MKKSFYDHKALEETWDEMVRKMRYRSRFPLVMNDRKPTLDEILKREPSISGGLEQTGERF